MKLYLSGGIAGVRDFVKHFKNHAKALEACGYEVVNPLEIGNKCNTTSIQASCWETFPATNVGADHTWECYLRWDLVEALQCDGVAVMPGAEMSRGARREIYVAGECGLPIRTVEDWIDLTVDLKPEDIDQVWGRINPRGLICGAVLTNMVPQEEGKKIYCTKRPHDPTEYHQDGSDPAVRWIDTSNTNFIIKPITTDVVFGPFVKLAGPEFPE
jgi:hypothetical protein